MTNSADPDQLASAKTVHIRGPTAEPGLKEDQIF